MSSLSTANAVLITTICGEAVLLLPLTFWGLILSLAHFVMQLDTVYVLFHIIVGRCPINKIINANLTAYNVITLLIARDSAEFGYCSYFTRRSRVQ